MHIGKSQSFMSLLAHRLFDRPPRALNPEELLLALSAEKRAREVARDEGRHLEIVGLEAPESVRSRIDLRA